MLGTGSRGWRWLDDVLLPLSIAVSYAAWVYPTLVVYVSDLAVETWYTGVAFWICLGTLLSARMLGRLAGRYRRSGLIVLLGGLGSVLVFESWVMVRLPALASLSLADAYLRRALIAGALCAAFLWWRGTRLAYDDHHEETSRTFAIGAVALALLVLVSHLYGQLGTANRSAYTNWLFFGLSLLAGAAIVLVITAIGWADTRKVVSWIEGILASFAVVLAGTLSLPAPETLGGPILLFVFAGLVARALLGLSWVLNTQRGRGGVRIRIDWVWLGIILGIILGTVILGVLAGQILAPQAIASALAWLWRIVVPLAWVLGLVLSALLWLLMELVSFLVSRWSIRLPQFQMPSMEELDRAAGSGLRLPILDKPGVRTLLVVVAVVAIVWVLYRAAKRLQNSGNLPTGVAEQRGRSLGLASLSESLGRLFSALWRETGSLFVSLRSGERTRRIVRRAYRAVLRRAVDVGVPRPQADTPRQYAVTLLSLCPGRGPDLEQLTRTYEMARYGPVPPTDAQANAAGEASGRVDEAIKGARPVGDTHGTAKHKF